MELPPLPLHSLCVLADAIELTGKAPVNRERAHRHALILMQHSIDRLATATTDAERAYRVKRIAIFKAHADNFAPTQI